MSLDRRVLCGVAASPGVAIGKVIVVDRNAVPVPRRRLTSSAVEPEIARLEQAMEQARREVEGVRDALPDDADAEHRLLLETQLMMHGDELLLRSASRAIREDRLNAEWALRCTVEAMKTRLQAAPEPYFRERAGDVAQVGEKVLRVLTGVTCALPDIVEPSILIASDLTPAEAAQLPTDRVIAIVTDAGSASSHTALVARALSVPAIVGVRDVTRAVGPGDTVIVDALRGEVILFPNTDEQARARARAARFEAFKGKLRDSERRTAETSDGMRVALCANVQLELDVDHAMREAADGIGLYRTEYLYLGRREPPNEADQSAIYRRVARRIAPRSVTFRTFDLGADKMPDGQRGGPNPALGLRALRMAFEHPELLVTQLRALLRASVEGNVRIMFPMVAGPSDMRHVRVLLERARQDLEAEGAAYGPVPIGSMLEVPSAVLMADRLAPECDFFSIGTNDLTQYTLAVDRGDPRVAHLARALEPAVLRLLESARAIAETADVPIGVCGDLAADPVAVPVLVGLGFARLSMPMAAIPLVREVVRRIDRSSASELAAEALNAADANEVERLVADRFGNALGELWQEQGIELPRG